MKKASVILFLILSLCSYSQINQGDANAYSKQADELIRNYFSQLDLLHGDRISVEDKGLVIKSIKSDFFENDDVIVCNDIDLSSNSVEFLKISTYLENIRLFHDASQDSYQLDSLFISDVFTAKDFYFIKAEIVRKICIHTDKNPKCNSSRIDAYMKFVSGKDDLKIYSIKWHEDNLSQFKKPETTLSTSTQNISFEANGGKKLIYVTTNVQKYEIAFLPDWCKAAKYPTYFEITCNANSSEQSRNDWLNVTAGNKTIRVNISQLGVVRKAETMLNVSMQDISFEATGGEKSVSVTTNADKYEIEYLPNWCTVTKYSTWFGITCNANSSIQRRDSWFNVLAGNKALRINISQSGVVKKIETILNASCQDVSFGANRGKKSIFISTNADKYEISYLPNWCSVTKYSTWFEISCDVNNSYQDRKDWFKVTAGDKEIRINVQQSGVAYPITIATNKKKKKCFNCPNTNYSVGLTLGYLEDYFKYAQGTQLGIRIEPLFKYGFGLNTGIFLEDYSNDSQSEFDNAITDQYVLNVPLHLEYRLNFWKWFNVFAYGGIGLNIATNDYSEDFWSLPTTLEIGGGVRFNHIQFNVGQSVPFSELNGIQDLERFEALYQKLSLSVSYMF
jgi:hypothetical protein